MAHSHELRWGGVAGFGYAVAVLLAYFLPGSDIPRVDDQPRDIVAFFADNRAMVLTQALLFTAAAALLVWFAAALAQTLRDRSPSSDLPGALLGGTVLVSGLTLVGAALYGSIAYRGGDVTTMVAAFDLTQITFALYGVAAAVPFTALAIGILRTQVMPAWMAWFAGLCAALGLVGALFIGRTDGTLVPGGPVVTLIPFLAYTTFVVVASVFMVREHLPTAAASPRAIGHT